MARRSPFPIRILDVYAAREFLAPFVGCIAGVTLILVSTLLFELSDFVFVRKVSASTVGALLVYRLPSLLTLSIPVGVLFASVLGLGRLAKDSETVVIRCVGVPFLRLAMPCVALGLVIVGLTYSLNERVVPWSNHRYETIIRQIVYEDGPPTIDEHVFVKDGDGRAFYIGSLDSSTQQMRDIVMYEFEGGVFPELVTARTGTYDDGVWRLSDVVTRRIGEDGFVVNEVRSDSMTLRSELAAGALLGEQKTTSEMNREELLEHIHLFRKSGISVDSFETDYAMKLSLPFAALIFALVGAPLSIRSARGGRYFGVAVSLVIAFLYYVSISVSRSLGVNGMLPPAAAAWLPNVFFLGVGAVLFVRAERSGT